MNAHARCVAAGIVSMSPSLKGEETVGDRASRVSNRLLETVGDRRQAANRDDERVKCLDCSNYSRSKRNCSDFVNAGLAAPDVGPDFAAMPQRCPAHCSRTPTPTKQREQWPAFSLKAVP